MKSVIYALETRLQNKSSQESNTTLGHGILDLASPGSPVASVTTLQYQGLTTITTSDDGKTRTEEKSVAGQVVRITDALQAQVAHDYDAFGNLLSTLDALGNRVSMSYDIRGRKLNMIDPDSGTWTYTYDALGQLKSQQSAKQTLATRTTMQYDVLGRMTQRIEPEATATWSYDTNPDGSKCSAAAYSYGKLCQSKTDTLVKRSYAYDDKLRPVSSRTDITGGPSTASMIAYDVNGRIDKQTYPSGLQVQYNYTGKGFLKSLSNTTAMPLAPLPATSAGIPAPNTTLAANTALWTAVSYNAWGQSEQYLYSNGVTSKASVDPVTGRLAQLTAGLGSGSSAGTELLKLSYVWNSLGQITSRTDANGVGDGSGAVTDSLTYDGLGRLVKYDVNATAMPGLSRTVELRYNAGGLLLYKSDVGVYNYAAQGTPGVKPHALQSLASNTAGVASATYGYDANGNLTAASAGKYRSISYTSFNLPDGQQGVQGPAGGSSYAWAYDESHQRIKEVRTSTEMGGTSTRTTWMLHPNNAGGLGFESETVVNASGTTTSNRHYLSVGGASIGVIVSTGALPTLGAGQQTPVVLASLNIVKIEFWHKDHLGSLMATSDHRGMVTARYSYDPFGKRRQTSGAYDANGVLVVNWTTNTNNGGNRGYTGHEHLDDVGLIHMNGRIFDPTLGRFLQADPFIQNPSNLQNFDRYGYCFNNPITCSDPSGYFSISALVKRAAVFLTFPTHINQFRLTRELPGQRQIDWYINTNSWAYTIGGFLASYYGGAPGAISWASYNAYAVSGSSTEANKAGIKAYAMAAMMDWAGDVSGDYPGAWQSYAAHAASGCAGALIQHDNCARGAVASMASQYASENQLGGSTKQGQFAMSVMMGGTTSVIMGGKFENGATTAAFEYLFNCLNHPGTCTKDDIPEIRRAILKCNFMDAACTGRIYSMLGEASYQVQDFTQPVKDFVIFPALGSGAAFVPITLSALEFGTGTLAIGRLNGNTLANFAAENGYSSLTGPIMTNIYSFNSTLGWGVNSGALLGAYALRWNFVTYGASNNIVAIGSYFQKEITLLQWIGAKFSIK